MLLDVKYRITNTVAPIKRTKRLNIKATETEWIKKNAYTNWNWPIFPLYLYHQKCIDIEFSIDLMYFDFDDLKFSFFCGKTRITFVYTGRLRMFTKWRWRKKMLCTSFFLFFCKWFQYTKKKYGTYRCKYLKNQSLFLVYIYCLENWLYVQHQ